MRGRNRVLTPLLSTWLKCKTLAAHESKYPLGQVFFSFDEDISERLLHEFHCTKRDFRLLISMAMEDSGMKIQLLHMPHEVCAGIVWSLGIGDVGQLAPSCKLFGLETAPWFLVEPEARTKGLESSGWGQGSERTSSLYNIHTLSQYI